MKLYTKEMFLIAAEKCEVSMIDAKHIMKYIDEYVTPIELPTDEEIEKELFYQKQVMNPYPTEEYAYTAYEKGFMEGAKVVINKIQGGNDE
jgi:hypothetical protein